MKKKFFFTFGGDHLDSNGRSLFKRYCTVDAYSENQARAIMFAHRGNQWAFCYPQDQGRKIVERHSPTLIDIEDVMLHTD